MAIEKVIVIKADTSQADKSIEKVDDNIQQVDKSVQKVEKSTSKASKGFKALGTAIKATGIGLLVGLIAKLAVSFSQNNKVATVLNTTMIALSKAFNDLFDFVFDNIGKWTKSIKDAFENPVDILKSLGNAIKDNIQERFESLIDTLGFVGEAFKKLFERDFKGALESVKNAGKEFVDVTTGIDGTVDKVNKVVQEGTESIKEYAEETVNAAKEINNLRQSFEQVENQQVRLREAADRDAEAQRRLRDDYTKNIDERINANNELADVLDRQEKAEKASVQARINALNTEQQLLGFRGERANEIFALQTELIAIEAQQAGFRAEQEKNAIDLQKEKIELENTALDAQKERQLDQLEFEAEQEKTESDKIEKLRERLELENEILLEDIERKRELFAEDTQLRIDAEEEFLTAKQELTQKEIDLDNSRKSNEDKNRKDKERLDELEAKAKLDITKNTFALIEEVAGKGSKVGKALAVAQTTISTIEGTQNAFKTAQDSPITATFPAYPFIQAGIAAGFGALQVSKILSTDATGKSTSSASQSQSQGGGGGGVQAPSFNLVQGTGTNQIAESIQTQDQPLKAFVVSSDVSTSQSLDRNAVENASL